MAVIASLERQLATLERHLDGLTPALPVASSTSSVAHTPNRNDDHGLRECLIRGWLPFAGF